MEIQKIENVAPHSVELSTNAKGKVQASVKVYGDNAEVCAKEALRVLDLIKQSLGASFAGE